LALYTLFFFSGYDGDEDDEEIGFDSIVDDKAGLLANK
jgi:hypothetical protein